MMYVIEVGSGAMIYILSFIMISSGIQNLKRRRGECMKRHRPQGDFISLFLFFQNEESRLKIGIVWIVSF
jgi:hypothetical protein